jgi:galactokinase
MVLTTLDPVPRLLARVRAELSAAFDDSKPMRISRAPGRLDVMGGSTDYTGGLVCQATLDCGIALALQPRADRQLQIFSFNLFDEHLPFTFNISVDALASASTGALRREFAVAGRTWAGYVAGCLYLLHQNDLIDLKSPAMTGLNLALLGTVPMGVGVASSAALEVATMVNLADHFSVGDKVDLMNIAAMCQSVENQIIGSPGGIVDQMSCCGCEENALLRLVCQPHEMQSPLALPAGIRVIGINSNVKTSVGSGMYDKTRCAAFMGHTMIVDKMRQMGQAAGRALLSDPMRGYLANLDPEDYKRFFRPFLPESIMGRQFLADFGPTIDTVTSIDPDVSYHVLGATDHHVLEAHRVAHFAELISAAGSAPAHSREQGGLLDKAGHLMYASHGSYTNDAGLGADACDVLVKLVRERESAGLYGAKITGIGGGGTVAVLCDLSDRAAAAIGQIMAEYERQTGRKAAAFLGSSPGAWHARTQLI